MDENAEQCSLCRIAAGEDEPSGGWLIRSALVTAYPSAGNAHLGGWCQLQVNRHAPTLADLTTEEAAAIGVAANQLAQAALASTDIPGQRLYMYAMCEFVPHFHLVLGPAPETAAEVPRGGALLSRILARDTDLARADAARIDDRLRSILHASPH